MENKQDTKVLTAASIIRQIDSGKLTPQHAQVIIGVDEPLIFNFQENIDIDSEYNNFLEEISKLTSSADKIVVSDYINRDQRVVMSVRVKTNDGAEHETGVITMGFLTQEELSDGK